MIYNLVMWGLLLLAVALVAGWFVKGRKKKQPEAGPSVPNLDTAEDLVRIDQLHQQGKMTDEEYHAAKARLLS